MAYVSFSKSPASEVALRQGARPRGAVLEVAHDVFCQQQSLVNVMLVGAPGAGDGQWVLVDAGMLYCEWQIRAAARELYGDARPAAIVLTHGHFDHVGALPTLADEWGVPIYAHELELPYITGRSSYPPPDPTVGGGAMSWLSPLYPRGPFNYGERARPLPADGTVPGMPNWRWMATPGHSAGHVSFFRDDDRTLIVGDAFVTQRQESVLGVMLRQPAEVRRPPAYFTQDWHAAFRSIQELASLLPNVAITGHGLPMYGSQLRRDLDDLVQRWEEIGLPTDGRYVRQPVIANHVGTVAVPPPLIEKQLLTYGALTGGALLGLCAARALSSRSRR
jgi:glyoxylase-like metal-dependent hydrolase (beta-lactamase superfamily II)